VLEKVVDRGWGCGTGEVRRRQSGARIWEGANCVHLGRHTCADGFGVDPLRDQGGETETAGLKNRLAGVDACAIVHPRRVPNPAGVPSRLIAGTGARNEVCGRLLHRQARALPDQLPEAPPVEPLRLKLGSKPQRVPMNDARRGGGTGASSTKLR